MLHLIPFKECEKKINSIKGDGSTRSRDQSPVKVHVR